MLVQSDEGSDDSWKETLMEKQQKIEDLLVQIGQRLDAENRSLKGSQSFIHAAPLPNNQVPPLGRIPTTMAAQPPASSFAETRM